MTSRFARLSSLASLAFTAWALAAAGCATSDPIDPNADPNGDPQNNGEAICLLHNCTEDAHCGACTEGRNTCLVSEGRCVACDAATDSGCADGQECSSWGNCVPIGLECPTDSHGTPTITCSTSADCAACDPAHLMCDGGQCVGCTASDTSECGSTDICVGGECSPVCPSACTSDSDCSQCGSASAPAHACNQHICAECSPTHPCPNGETCSMQGACVQECGSDGKGKCTTDADCSGCGADNNQCNKPINSSTGTCGVAAAGCSDLGQGAAVLPDPWNQVTNTCSNDGDCAGVGITYNVGELLRDITGFDQISDANIEYPMSQCASISIGETSCGVCVPCQVDADCMPIDIDQVAGDAFGPLGALAAAFLLDQIFGENEHAVQMYCQAVAGGYGVCAPCPGIIYECGTTTGGGGGGSGSCDHDACTAGAALDPTCDTCAEALCAADAYCCDTAWDDVCVGEVATYCTNDCSGTGGGGGPVCHDECVAGGALDPTCNACVEAICNYDNYCCTTDWDSVCVGYVTDMCNPPC